MPSLSFLHGVVLGLPLVVLTALCVAYTGRVGKVRPWLHGPRPWVLRMAWGGLLILAWLVPISGMALMYADPSRWLTPQGTWQTLALPWMASWGMAVPMVVTTCAYLARRARELGHVSLWFRRALWGLMSMALSIVLLAALLGSMTTQGMFYP